MAAIVTENMPMEIYTRPLQLPVPPIPPPIPGAEAFGLMTWDLPSAITYTPFEEITATIELLNPSLEERLYGISYYFIDSHGVIAAEDYVRFSADSIEFSAFLLPPQGVIPMVAILTFKAPGAGYRFGLRMLLLEMVDSDAIVVGETSRLEVSLVPPGGVVDGGFPLALLAVMMIMIPVSMLFGTKKKEVKHD